ncbi:hypothetical protein [Streptomyces albicerus]|uniref:hypothetical protein n=1 Tax=Streptomyces albicerus TaxID=2569859 RepID=UPI001788BCD0|nr:hypothetical protein [Streptomyces albicerus]
MSSSAFRFGQVNLALACLILWDLTRPTGAHLQLPWWQQVLASPYPLLGLALMAWAAGPHTGAASAGPRRLSTEAPAS